MSSRRFKGFFTGGRSSDSVAELRQQAFGELSDFFIVFATITPDYFFPGSGVLLQRELGLDGRVAALDIRNACSGFIYALSIADQFIKTGMYKTVLVVGAEIQSTALDLTTRGRNTAVIFGDGAGAAVLRASDKPGILSTHHH